MREFDSPGLRELHRILRVSTGPPQLQELDDGIIQQMLELNAFLRRELTPQGSSGIFTASILNTHTGSDTETTLVNPYTPGTTFVKPEWGDPVAAGLDVWLLAAHAEAVTGLGDFGGGGLALVSDSNAMGWRNEANAIAVNSQIMTYDQELAQGAQTFLMSNANDIIMLDERGNGGIRIPREADTRIEFQTIKTGAGAATYKLFMILGLFPAGMGQDGRAR